jgi:hypothetical protein
MATSSTRTVTVNAAFLQEIKEVNEELWQLLKDVRQALADPLRVRSQRQRLLEMLEMLRDSLALHFALEEAYGYFEDPLHVAPRLCAQAAELRNEHRLLYTQISDLVEEAQQWHYRGQWSLFRSQLVAQFAAFDNRFQLHEEREIELIQEEYGDDIGVTD